jgi:hypothetical protein
VLALVSSCKAPPAFEAGSAQPSRDETASWTLYTSDEAPFRIRIPPGVAPPETLTEGKRRMMVVPFERAILSVIYWMRGNEPVARIAAMDRYAEEILAAGGFEADARPKAVVVPGARAARRTGFTHHAGLTGALVVAVREPWAFVIILGAEPDSPFAAQIDQVAASFEIRAVESSRP